MKLGFVERWVGHALAPFGRAEGRLGLLGHEGPSFGQWNNLAIRSATNKQERRSLGDAFPGSLTQSDWLPFRLATYLLVSCY